MDALHKKCKWVINWPKFKIFKSSQFLWNEVILNFRHEGKWAINSKRKVQHQIVLGWGLKLWDFVFLVRNIWYLLVKSQFVNDPMLFEFYCNKSFDVFHFSSYEWYKRSIPFWCNKYIHTSFDLTLHSSLLWVLSQIIVFISGKRILIKTYFF